MVTRKHPEVPKSRLFLANHFNNLGMLQICAHRVEDALASWQKGVAIQEKLVEQSPDVVQYRTNLAGSLTAIWAICILRCRQRMRPWNLYRKAIEIRRGACPRGSA